MIKELVDTLNETIEHLLSMTELSSSAQNEISDILSETQEKLSNILEREDPVSSEITPDIIDDIAALASEFADSDNEVFVRTASVLDQILLSIGTPSDAVAKYKAAQLAELDKLREKYKHQEEDRELKKKEDSSKDLNTKAYVDSIDKSIKEYRPLEASLSTRTCPDHPGAQVTRIADGVIQCELDKKIYNYNEGFTTMRGSLVPGGNVSLQTKNLSENAVPRMFFDTRETKLKQ